MRRPWMPLYVTDYLADTAHLTTTESGAYLHLIMHYWMHGGLPQEPERLAAITKLSLFRFQRLAPTLSKMFSDGWKHKRIEFELTQLAISAENGRKGGVKSGKSRRAKSANKAKYGEATGQAFKHSYSDKKEPLRGVLSSRVRARPPRVEFDLQEAKANGHDWKARRDQGHAALAALKASIREDEERAKDDG